MTFVKNPFWPGSQGYEPAKLDELVIRFLDDGTQLREYEAGNLDVVPVVPKMAPLVSALAQHFASYRLT